MADGLIADGSLLARTLGEGVLLRLGILQRYVIGQVVKSFIMALVAITIIFVLFMVMAEATRQGLSPQDILRVVPFIIPGSLPYTVPVAMLFAVSVVYGRMAGDNEVVAVKTAGKSALSLIAPTLWIGLALGGALAYMSADVIPRSNRAFRDILFEDMEDMFYKTLKKFLEFDTPNWPFFIRVNDVQGRKLIRPTFKHRMSRERPNEYDLTITAKSAVIHFDVDKLEAEVELEDAVSEGGDTRPFIFLIDGKQVMRYPIPKDRAMKLDPRVQEKTNRELFAEEVKYTDLIEHERKRRAAEAAFEIAAGRLKRGILPELLYVGPGLDWMGVRSAYSQDKYWKIKQFELRTERNLRVALAFGVFFFACLGAPVGIRFARRDYLSAFITCFVPIILLYYPPILAGVNLGKQGITPPWIVWVSNGLLGFLAGFVALPPVMKH